MSWYELTTLPNGLRVITERMPGIRSAAIGCWVDTGTRDELGNEAGASHFLEHLLFKGSEQVSAREISETFDAIGAQSNAFTTKEQTCFWTRLLDEELSTGLRLLAEMLQRPAFREHEIDSERQVVIEEILMSEDDPDDTAFEAFSATMFAGHPLERPILGTRESITSMSPDDIAGYWKRRYTAGSTVVAIVSSLPHSQVLAEVERWFGDWGGDGLTHEHLPLRGRQIRGPRFEKPSGIQALQGRRSGRRQNHDRLVPLRLRLLAHHARRRLRSFRCGHRRPSLG